MMIKAYFDTDSAEIIFTSPGESFDKLIMKNALGTDYIEFLKDAKYCKNKFDVNFPVLKEVLPGTSVSEQRNIKGHPRYYADLLSIGGKKYLLCNDWYDRNRRYFLSWLSRFELEL